MSILLFHRSLSEIRPPTEDAGSFYEPDIVRQTLLLGECSSMKIISSLLIILEVKDQSMC